VEAIGMIFGVYGQALTEGDLPMALSQSAAFELLEALRTGEAVDVIRESVRMVMQELIEAEASQAIGAARYQRSPSRVTERNGVRPRMLSTQAGDVQLRIPKLRKGSFYLPAHTTGVARSRPPHPCDAPTRPPTWPQDDPALQVPLAAPVPVPCHRVRHDPRVSGLPLPRDLNPGDPSARSLRLATNCVGPRNRCPCANCTR
jgi:hypothetical protein